MQFFICIFFSFFPVLGCSPISVLTAPLASLLLSPLADSATMSSLRSSPPLSPPFCTDSACLTTAVACDTRCSKRRLDDDQGANASGGCGSCGGGDDDDDDDDPSNAVSPSGPSDPTRHLCCPLVKCQRPAQSPMPSPAVAATAASAAACPSRRNNIFTDSSEPMEL